MIEPRWEWLPVILALSLTVACNGDDDGLGPAIGTIEVTAATTGDDIDPDGYTVHVGSASQALGVNASATFSGLDAGDHEVELTDVAANCTVAGSNPRMVTISAAGTAPTVFNVTCVQQTGSIEVTASTTGSMLDPDGYLVAVDGGASQSVGINGSTTFPAVVAGDREVELTDVASNCAVAGNNPRTVTVTAGGMASTSFDVTCAVRTELFLVTPIGLSFGEVVVAETSPSQSVEVTNVSSSSQTVSMAGGAAGAPFPGSQNCQGKTLAPGESCQITYRFEPTDAGEVSGSTNVTINGEPSAFDFRGVGIADADDATDTFLVTPFTFDFGEVIVGATSPPQSVEVKNVSDSSQTLSVVIGAAGVFGGSQDCQDLTLAPGESCQFTYRFTPAAAGEVTQSTNVSINGQSFAFDFRGVGIVVSP